MAYFKLKNGDAPKFNPNPYQKYKDNKFKK